MRIIVSKRNVVSYFVGSFVAIFVLTFDSSSRRSLTEFKLMTETNTKSNLTNSYQSFASSTRFDFPYDKSTTNNQQVISNEMVLNSFVSYPWRNDPTCKHFTVKVILYMQ